VESSQNPINNHLFEQKSDNDLSSRILGLKKKHAANLRILAHHYQDQKIVELADYVGDSFQLSWEAARAEGRYIVFCGVRFMAESARILARKNQVIIIPDKNAGCPMADMANIFQVKRAWNILNDLNPDRRIIPVAYMNSSSEIKAFCGEHGGVVCTSSNAARIFEWAWAKGDLIFFLPDEHLGWNTAATMGIKEKDILFWSPLFMNDYTGDRKFSRAKLVIWKGFCYVHRKFSTGDIDKARKEFPGVHIIVHPECTREVVQSSDSSGSTAAIVNVVKEAETGKSICIGTEINLVKRLAAQYPDKKIIPLKYSECLNMAKINLSNLCKVLENPGTLGVVQVNSEITANARLALDRMLRI
jgi:quinolinate synthase